MCEYCGCGMEGGFQSVKVTLPAERKAGPGGSKETPPGKPGGSREKGKVRV